MAQRLIGWIMIDNRTIHRGKTSKSSSISESVVRLKNVVENCVQSIQTHSFILILVGEE